MVCSAAGREPRKFRSLLDERGIVVLPPESLAVEHPLGAVEKALSSRNYSRPGD